MNKEQARAIIERVEQVRQGHRLNKSDFARRLGLKPQTYNNFIGAQGSKPSAALIVGLLRAFPDVRPRWLLLGSDAETPPGKLPWGEAVPVEQAVPLTARLERCEYALDALCSMWRAGRPDPLQFGAKDMERLGDVARLHGVTEKD